MVPGRKITLPRNLPFLSLSLLCPISESPIYRCALPISVVTEAKRQLAAYIAEKKLREAGEKRSTMMHGRRTAMALLCLMFMALMLRQDVEARKPSWTAQEKQSHGSAGSRGTGTTTTTTPEPCSGRGGKDQGQQVQCDTSKWEELHTDYIYTQDVKHNP